MRRLMWMAPALALMLLLAACAGRVGEPEPHVAASGDGETHVVEIAMTAGQRFDPEQVIVSVGQTVRFRVTNLDGRPHELFIGDELAQAAHARLSHNPRAALSERVMDQITAEHGAGRTAGVFVEPGQAGELSFTFSQPGELIFGCHVDRHYDLGMRGVIRVEG
jgi:uncharacterized cupredoxin-like copper-binding protein